MPVSRLRLETGWWSLSRQRRDSEESIGSANGVGGAYRDRTDDLLNAIQSLSQLS